MTKRDFVDWLVVGSTIVAAFLALLSWMFPDPLRSGIVSGRALSAIAGSLILVVLVHVVWKALDTAGTRGWQRLATVCLVLMSSIAFVLIGSEMASTQPSRSGKPDTFMPAASAAPTAAGQGLGLRVAEGES